VSADGSRRNWRIAAVVLFLALPVAAAGMTAVNVIAWRETQDLIARQEALLAQLDARLARMSADGGATVDTRAIYLPAASRPLAGADLQQRLVTAVGAVSGRLIETQLVDDEREGEPDGIRLRATFDVDNAGLLTLLHGLETGLPLMMVDQVTVRQLPTQDATALENPILRVDLVVRAHFKAEA
jgi:uncharacterized SAM-binding protein YcdF (DUF218 family)